MSSLETALAPDAAERAPLAALFARWAEGLAASDVPEPVRATLRRVIDGWFHRAGVTPRTPMELGNTEAIKKLVEAGLGWSVTSWFSVESEVRNRTVTALRLTPALERQIGLVRRRDKPRTPALDAFLDALDDLRRVLERRRPRGQ